MHAFSLSFCIFVKLLKKNCMLENFDYGQVPAQFAHCFRAECRRSGECLRYQIGTCVPKERQSVLVVNPARIASTAGCDHFMPCVLLRHAWGMTQLLNELPYRKTKVLRAQMREYFGKTHFYRLMRKERSFTPADQQYVADLFRRSGIEKEPAFDAYTYTYQWE